MIVLTVKYTIRLEDADAILADLQEMTRLVEENEPGCRTYRVHQSLEKPDELLLYEAYDDKESFDAHAASPYFQEIVMGRIVPKLIGRERTLWSPAF